MNIQAQKIANELLNDKRSIVEDVKRAKSLINYKRLFDESDYYSSYRSLYYGAIVLSFVSQILTAFSSYNFYDNVNIESFVTLNELKPILIPIILIGLETGKYILCRISTPTIFTNKPKIGLLLISASLIIWTVYTSIIGGGKVGINDTKTIIVSSDFDKTKSKTINDYDLEIEKVKQEYDKSIKELVDATKELRIYCWQPKVAKTVLAKETQISELQKNKEDALNRLRNKRDNEIESITSKNDNQLTKIEKDNKSNEKAFRIGFCIFDLLFVLCTYFIYNYYHESKFRSQVEEMSENFNSNESIKDELVEVERYTTAQKQIEVEKPKIGFQQTFNQPQSKQETNKPSSAYEPKETINEPIKIENKMAKQEEKIVYVDRVVEKIVYVPQDRVIEKEVPKTGKYCEWCNTQYSPPALKNRFCCNNCKNNWWAAFDRIVRKTLKNKELDKKDIDFRGKLEKEQPSHYEKYIKLCYDETQK